MVVLAATLTVLCGLVTLVWTTRHLLLTRERKTGFTLSSAYAGPPADAPFINVFVAAKDEAENIETCVRTMLDQDYPNYDLTVCNDRSSDATGEIVQRIAAGNPRCRLVNITHLPDGWCGKNNAMQTGIAMTDREWICMIDADCRQISSRTLSTAMQYALDNRIDMLSILATLEMKGFWENVIQPVCSGVMMIWFRPDKVNDPARKNAYANGAFILMRRSTYQAIGTHEAVKMCVNEDMHMAARAKQLGQRLCVVKSDGLYVCRMYTSLKAMVRGWGRIFYGTFGTLPRLLASMLVMLMMGVMPYAAAAVGLGMAGVGHGPWWAACGWTGLLAAAMQVSVIFRFYGLVGSKPLLAWTYPLGCGVALYALGVSLSKLRKGATVTWRNTAYVKQ